MGNGASSIPSIHVKGTYLRTTIPPVSKHTDRDWRMTERVQLLVGSEELGEANEGRLTQRWDLSSKRTVSFGLRSRNFIGF